MMPLYSSEIILLPNVNILGVKKILSVTFYRKISVHLIWKFPDKAENDTFHLDFFRVSALLIILVI